MQVLAQQELELLRADLEAPSTIRSSLRGKGLVHKRIFGAVRQRYLTFRELSRFLENQVSPAEGESPNVRRDRRGYFLDPWNNPYWISYRERGRTFLYSFGPNRRRDSDFVRLSQKDSAHEEAVQGDDIAVEVEVVLAKLRAKSTALYEQGRYAEGAEVALEAVQAAEAQLGPDDPYVATLLNSLARSYRAQEDYTQAEPLYLQALAITEKALGPDHPNLAAPLNNLGSLYRAQGNYGAAEPLYLRALAITEKTLGPDHPNLVAPLNNLGELYRAQGNYGAAEPLYLRALAIVEKTLGPDHPKVAILLENMAQLYSKTGRRDEAKQLQERAQKIRTRNQE